MWWIETEDGYVKVGLEQQGRDYYLTWTLELADEKEREKDTHYLASFSTGGSISNLAYYTDEDIDRELAWRMDFLKRRVMEARDRELELERQKALPFWKRWVGGV
jgi:hypothetical protein